MGDKKRILFFQLDRYYMQGGIEVALNVAQVEYDIVIWKCDGGAKDIRLLYQEKYEEVEEILLKKWKEKSYDIIFSLCYSSAISNFCQDKGILFVSWSYDAILPSGKSLWNSCNRIYMFDRNKTIKWKKENVNMQHLPLAVDSQLFDITSKGKEQNAYNCDIAFVGSLYLSKIEKYVDKMDEYMVGMIEGVINTQIVTGKQGLYMLDEMLSDEFVNGTKPIWENCIWNEQYKEYYVKEMLEDALGTEIAGRERLRILSELQKNYKVNLYTGSSNLNLNKVNQMGIVDYYTQMPQVFRQAKINLNITFVTIESGIPLRVLDVLGCGGFLITNYQSEIVEYFEDGKDLVIYYDINDLLQKVEYYLSHDEERRQIAQNGYQKVQKLFSFEDRLRKMQLIS